MALELYATDIESTGLDPISNDVIEISLIRLSNKEQKTFYLKPLNPASIQLEALKINGYTLEEIMKFTDANLVLPEIENFIMEDNCTANQRVLVGQNVQFDIRFLEALWSKLNTKDSYPFSYHYLDTKQISMFLDLVEGNLTDEVYSLAKLVEKYGIKKEKKHKADSDTRMTASLFEQLVKKAKSWNLNSTQ